AGNTAIAGGNAPDASSKTTRKSSRKRRRWLVNGFRAIAVLFLLFSLIGGVYLYNFIQNQVSALPDLPSDPAALLSESSLILASDGSELGHVFGERRTFVHLNQISPITIQALLAAEDHRFFEHDGIDFRRIAGAAWKTFNGEPEGASTITMQLVRNYFPSVKRTTLAERKAREMLMARRITAEFSKDETLELYLNTVAFGLNSFGIEAAAKRFFSTKASELTLSQAALLVGVLKGPSRYNPFSNAQIAKERRNLIILRMKDLGMITDAQANAAVAEPLGLNPTIYNPSESIAPHFVDYVRRIAEEWAAQNGYNLKKDGLKIRTTLDPHLQNLALQSVAKQSQSLQNVITREFGLAGSRQNDAFWRTRQPIENDFLRKTSAFKGLIESGTSDAQALATLKNDRAFIDEVRAPAAQLEAGFAAIDPHSGQVKVWVGGRNYNIDQYDKVASAARQPGSVFKPFLYAAALDSGFSPYYLVEDRLKTFTTSTRGETWTPTNAGGGASGRLVTMAQGLTWSKNTVSAHLISRVGPQKVISLARKMGITSPLLPVPSLALGTSETTLLEMVHSYSTFADYGTFHNLSVIASIEDRNGKVIATFPSEPKKAISTQTAYTMIDMLRDVIDRGTGAAIRHKFGIRGDVAGKTGTTQNNADGWFIAMHSDLVVGAWVGFNDQRIGFQSDYWGQGGHNALLLVGDFLQKATKGPGPFLKTSRFNAPAGYRYPSKPVYSGPASEAIEDVEVVTLPIQRITPISTGIIPKN
ncbi:MAG: transglycosylase domain-containing protein, partial [Bacteroidetes bacterium]|nr:transglycosylase domain-containing protein [Bacteroidota bacterium]